MWTWIYVLIGIGVGWMWISVPAPTPRWRLTRIATLTHTQPNIHRHPYFRRKILFSWKKIENGSSSFNLQIKIISSRNRFRSKGKFLSLSIHTDGWLLCMIKFTFIMFIREFTDKSRDRLDIKTPKEKLLEEKISNNYT